jgi:hypothetical protein
VGTEASTHPSQHPSLGPLGSSGRGAQLLAWHQVAGITHPQGGGAAVAQPPRPHQHTGTAHLVHHPRGPGTTEAHADPIAPAEVAEVLRWGRKPLLGRDAGAPDLLLGVLSAGHQSQRGKAPPGRGSVVLGLRRRGLWFCPWKQPGRRSGRDVGCAPAGSSGSAPPGVHRRGGHRANRERRR